MLMAKELHDINVACVSLWPGAVKTEYLLQQGSVIGDKRFLEEDMESPEFSGIICPSMPWLYAVFLNWL